MKSPVNFKILISAFFFLLSTTLDAQDLLQQVSDSISQVKATNRGLEKLGYEINSKNEELNLKDKEIDIVQSEMREHEKRRPSGFDIDPKVLNDFNKRVIELTNKQTILFNERNILIEQGMTLENNINLLSEKLANQLISLIDLLKPHATCAEKLYLNPSMEEIEKCWSCYLSEECAIRREINDSIKNTLVSKRGAPEYMYVLRDQQLEKIAKSEVSKSQKANPAEVASKKNVNQTPPQTSTMEQMTKEVKNFLKNKIDQMRYDKFRVRKPSTGGTRG